MKTVHPEVYPNTPQRTLSEYFRRSRYEVGVFLKSAYLSSLSNP